MTKKSTAVADSFPLKKEKVIRGNRRLARQKVLQLLVAMDAEQSDRLLTFDHVFFREFTFEDVEHEDSTRLLHPTEVVELESDTPIQWLDKDVTYAHALLNSARNSADDIDELIRSLADNWELERIALIDRLLLRMGVAELMKFSDIPTKVTINETIELAKMFSTEKSGVFINGILDKALEELKAQGRIVKEGRGLIDRGAEEGESSAADSSPTE